MDQLHFERFEYKYVIPEALTDDIRRFVAPYVDVDPNAAGMPGGRYTIHNLYLDTPRLDFYRACMNEHVERQKLRVRWYDSAAEGPFFLEVKRRVRDVIIKDRARVTREELDEILMIGRPGGTRPHGRSDLRRFLGTMATTGARPTLFVRYSREPFESVFGNYARITFDRSICFQDVARVEFPEDPRAWCYVDASWATKGQRTATILELKMTTEVPRWMSDLAAEFGLRRTGFSKYARSVQHRSDSAWRRHDAQRFATVGV